MCKMMESWPFRVGALVLTAIVLYPTAYTLLPRTADGVTVTVARCATVYSAFDCRGTTVFRRTFTDEATVSAVHATLDGLRAVNPWTNISCNAGTLCDPTHIYSFDLLWHGRVVRSYLVSVHGAFPVFWAVSTLGLELPATETEGAPTWQDLTRLTGMPVAPTAWPAWP